MAKELSTMEIAAWEERLKQEGFQNLRLCLFKGGTDFGDHSHNEYTVQFITKGEVIIVDDAGTTTHHAGECLKFPRGTRHCGRCGEEDVGMIVGMKK